MPSTLWHFLHLLAAASQTRVRQLWHLSARPTRGSLARPVLFLLLGAVCHSLDSLVAVCLLAHDLAMCRLAIHMALVTVQGRPLISTAAGKLFDQGIFLSIVRSGEALASACVVQRRGSCAGEPEGGV